MYRLKFFENEVLFSDDHKITESEIKREFSAEEGGLYKYLESEEKKV